MQYDCASKWKTKFCQAEQPQHDMVKEMIELISLPFLKLESYDVFLPNTTVATLFVDILG